MRINAAILCVLVGLLPSGPARGQEAARLVEALQQQIEATIAAAEPSIACIVVSRSEDYRRWEPASPGRTPGQLGRFNGDMARLAAGREPKELQAILALDLAHPEHVPESYGSGIAIDASGLILTNAHVVRNATKVYVRLPGNRGSYADIHASDPRSDLAVLRLLDPPGDLKPLKFGDGGRARKGEMVVVLSNPFAAGFRDGSPSAAGGMIANIRRRVSGQKSELERDRQLHHLGILLQVDTKLDLGCSGGALLNLKGEMIGLTTALAALSGTDVPGGFAIPLDDGIRRIIEVLKRGEEVEYGFLGVTPLAEPGNQRGVRVTNVLQGSPAQLGRLAANDLIVGIDGKPVQDTDDLFYLIGTGLAGNTVRLDVLRGGGKQAFPIAVKLAKYYLAGPIIAAHRPPARAGLRVDYTSIISQRGAPWARSVPAGVVIREVVPNSPADKAQLQTDKVITHVDKQPVFNPAEFYAAMAKAGPSVAISFRDAEGREEQVKLDNP